MAAGSVAKVVKGWTNNCHLVSVDRSLPEPVVLHPPWLRCELMVGWLRIVLIAPSRFACCLRH